ncbi:MAG: phosphoglucomutase/phosphomannomutase family protein [Chloroflexi bacterium]|jgi:alpha-D-glucose phosphate-specific phosphoglucomutase|uniref:phosphoglucomutase/phosphomannomutase family protein n=2 Tax=Candidatus Flexifilum breve TaxID=3140694 RepID=UPI00313711B5|nr:phosphoglucomutase/phosphomannomutase family protein [Chloroflexota bacterium]
MIRFGTDGWRAVIADTFTFANLRMISQAVADSVKKNHVGSEPPQVVIGYDTRFLSDRFAAETARVLAGNGIIAWLTRTDAPTPAISYNVKEIGADAGVVITASHNPPRYNGFKLKASYGGSATAEECARVEEALVDMERDARGPNIMEFQKAVDQGLIRRFDPAWSYYQHLATLVDLDKISEGELNIVSDAMWGAGRGAFTSILSRTRCHVTEIRGALNPGFGGIHPEPILKNLNELVAAVQRNQADVGLATDGDADRIGAVDARGNFIDPHHVMALALRHLVERKGQTGEVVKTVSTTLMIDSICRKHNLTLHETPVGFNHIGDLMMHKDILIGGEESGGISIKGHIPEGDGIIMGLLLLEIMATEGAPLHEIVADLQAEHGPAHYSRLDVHLTAQKPKKQIVRALQDSAPATLNGEQVVRVDTMDGIKFYMSDNSWLLIRPSGTEPVLRTYAEARTPEAVKALLEAGDAMGQRVTGH